MDYTHADVGKQCNSCERKIEIAHEQPGYVLISCSEFCAITTEEQKEAWRNRRNADPNALLVGPCEGCGIPLEDFEWKADVPWQCSDCARKAKEKRRVALLREVLRIVTVDVHLRKRIRDELRGEPA